MKASQRAEAKAHGALQRETAREQTVLASQYPDWLIEKTGSLVISWSERQTSSLLLEDNTSMPVYSRTHASTG